MTARPVMRAVALETVLAAIGLTLWWAGRAVPAPPLTSWSAASRWYASVGPDVAIVSLVRACALAVAVWLVVATAAQLLVGVGAPAALRWAADLLAPRSLQRFVHGLAGFSLSAGLAVAVPSAGTLLAEPPPSTATLHLVPAPAPPAAPAPVAVPVAAPRVDTFVVEPGDSLWSIAEEALTDAGHEQPDDAAVDRYWRRLIEANRPALVDPGNPDLIYPGQALLLPTP